MDDLWTSVSPRKGEPQFDRRVLWFGLLCIVTMIGYILLSKVLPQPSKFPHQPLRVPQDQKTVPMPAGHLDRG